MTELCFALIYRRIAHRQFVIPPASIDSSAARSTTRVFALYIYTAQSRRDGPRGPAARRFQRITAEDIRSVAPDDDDARDRRRDDVVCEQRRDGSR